MKSQLILAGWVGLHMSLMMIPVSAQALAPSEQDQPLLLAQAQPLVSGQRVRVKKLTRDMASVRGSIVTTGPSTLQDPATLEKLKKRFGQFTDALKKYPQLEDPDVKAARAEYAQLQQALSAEFKRASAQQQELGDVQQRLARAEQDLRAYAVPQPLAVPFTAEQAQAWVDAAGKARTAAEHYATELETIANLAYLPNNRGTVQSGAPYDAADVKRLREFAASNHAAVQSNYARITTALDARMQQIDSDVLTRWQEDPNSDQRWRFTAPGAQEEAFGLYDEAIAVAQSSQHLAAVLQRDSPRADQLVEQLQAAKAAFSRNKAIAIETARLPEPQSTDADMLAIAAEVLAKPKYGFGEHGRIVLTTPAIVTREKKSSEVTIDDADVSISGEVTLSGTETTWTYRWQEFRFAAPLHDPDSNTWHIWWITAKNFSSGGNKTPLNQWVSGQATKGVPILAEHAKP